jgi:hypothetical protein
MVMAAAGAPLQARYGRKKLQVYTSRFAPDATARHNRFAIAPESVYAGTRGMLWAARTFPKDPRRGEWGDRPLGGAVTRDGGGEA